MQFVGSIYYWMVAVSNATVNPYLSCMMDDVIYLIVPSCSSFRGKSYDFSNASIASNGNPSSMSKDDFRGR